VIDEYRQGRIFFGGDTAHLNIPTGGFGFNTGMQETHNLAWKMAAVLRGDGARRLARHLPSERRPIAVFNVEKSRENAINIRDVGATFGGYVPDNDEIDLDTPKGRRQRAEKSAAILKQKTHFLFLGQEIGFGYWTRHSSCPTAAVTTPRTITSTIRSTSMFPTRGRARAHRTAGWRRRPRRTLACRCRTCLGKTSFC